ncbi:hypothetical protein [Paenisporosarcina sp. TG20]|uniref:hypothetical protein n=1 Tax=Paenisporosarcina sp. TG20 TaxID=1211706 RepID=UPI0002D6038A|nr:hypothetical protein [Paenisporosarcina sp. TG20]
MNLTSFTEKLIEDKVKEVVMCGTKRTKQTTTMELDKKVEIKEKLLSMEGSKLILKF